MSDEYDEIRQACDENIAAMQRTLTESAVQLAIARDEIVDLTEALTNKYALENEMAVRREWVGLTGDEIEDLPKGGTWWEIIRAAEAILKEKNT